MIEFSTIHAAIEAAQAGRVVVVVFEDQGEHSGLFACAAERTTPDTISFFASHGKGLVSCALLPDAAQRLDLQPLESRHVGPSQLAYSLPVDVKGPTHGITATARCETIRSLANANSRSSDFIRPGHIHPAIAKEGGVLRRAGYAEAGVDLARLAGLTPASTICQILNQEGELATLHELSDVAKQHDLPIIGIKDLIRFRQTTERLISRSADAHIPTEHGRFEVIAYDVLFETQQPVVFTMGDLTSQSDPLVRIHSSCMTGDLLGSLRCDCGEQFQMALAMIAKEGVGALVYLPQEGRGIGLAEKIRAYNLQDQGLDTVEANLALGHEADLRDYGVGIQILKDLGISNVRLMTNNPKKADAFIYGGYDLRVAGRIPIVPPTNKHNADYIATKRDKLGHALP